MGRITNTLILLALNLSTPIEVDKLNLAIFPTYEHVWGTNVAENKAGRMGEGDRFEDLV